MPGMTDTSKPTTAPVGAASVGGRKAVDWDKMEPAWRAGIKSKLELSKEFDVSRAAIDKHWEKAGVERDLTARIQAKADALVAQQAVTREVTPATKLIESEIVEANAGVQASIRIAHRKDIGRSRTLAMRLLEELELQTKQVPELGQLGELMRSPDDRGVDKLNEVYQKVISLPGRTKTMKDLGDTLKTLIGLERQAFSMDDDPESLDNAKPKRIRLEFIDVETREL